MTRARIVYLDLILSTNSASLSLFLLNEIK